LLLGVEVVSSEKEIVDMYTEYAMNAMSGGNRNDANVMVVLGGLVLHSVFNDSNLRWI
jgi:hypothetical protein